MWNIVEHLNNPKDVLKKVKSYLKKQGYLVIHLPTINNVLSRIEYKIIWGWLTKEKTHIYRPSIKEFKKLLKDLSYEIIEEYSGQFIPFFLTRNKIVMNSACQYLVILKNAK
jgi:2-polyprenyl-3-methyl-5-hydroxy-6-metoxy-1,4-benzoquinol methylase